MARGRYRDEALTARVLAAWDGASEPGRAAAAAAAAGCDRATVYRIVRAREGKPARRDAKGPGAGSQVVRCPAGATDSGEATTAVGRDGDTVTATGGGAVKTLAGLLAEAQVDASAWSVKAWTANVWGNADDQRWQVKAHLERIPEFVRGVEPVCIPLLPAPPKRQDEPRTTVLFGDLHAGYDALGTGRCLVPYHDERAADLAVQLVERVEPDTVVLLGDLLDLAALSTKYRRPPESRYTVQPALVAVHAWLCALRRACRSARIVYLAGNHEDRLAKYMLDRGADEVLPLSDPGGAPLLSVPRLLGLDGLGVEYVPRATYVDGVKVWHSDVVRKGGGATVATLVAAADECQAVGHGHRREYAARTLHRGGRAREVWAFDPGCLCRTDGTVPGSDPDDDWQQGAAVVTAWGDDAAVELAPIADGRMTWRGRVYDARPDSCASGAAA